MFLPSRTWATTFHTRTADLPHVENDGSALTNNRTDATVTWVGHSTLLIQLDGVTILTDPQWSERASPVTFAGPKRLMSPGVSFEQLPTVDLVVISHDHYDHLDVDTVQRLARTHHPLFLVPLGLKAWFADIGITEVAEMDWWESRQVRGLTGTGLPARHFSGRSRRERNRRLCSAGARAAGTSRILVAGDQET